MEPGDCASTSLAKTPESLPGEHKAEGPWTEKERVGTAEKRLYCADIQGLIRHLLVEC